MIQLLLQFGQSSLLVSVDGSIQRASTELNNNLMGKGLQSQESRPSILKTNGEGLTRRYICSTSEHLHHIFPTRNFQIVCAQCD